MTIYDVLIRPLVTEKGVIKKDNELRSALKLRPAPIRRRSRRLWRSSSK